MSTLTRGCIPLAAAAALLACAADSADLPLEAGPLFAAAHARSGWSDPVPLPFGTINMPDAQDQAPSLSKDGLSLYFGSTRDPGAGNFDLWVARRACLSCRNEERGRSYFEYRVGSGTTAAAKAPRRSSHFMHTPQCIPSRGAAQVSVCSKGRCACWGSSGAPAARRGPTSATRSSSSGWTRG
jgi:hypothetical protein